MRAAIRFSAFVLLFAGVVTLRAQDRMLTADDVKALQKKYKAERDIAANQKFPPQSLELADQLAKRAQTSLESNSFREAARLIREARWQIPYLPADLPQGVSRVFGNTRMRHGDWVNVVVFNPDGTQLASCSRDG